MRILPIVGAVLVGVMLIIVGAAGSYYFLVERPSAVGPHLGADAEVQPRDNVPIEAKRLDQEAIFQLLALTDAPRRNSIMDSSENFQKFINQEIANQAVLSAAYANEAHSSQVVSALMERASQKVLAAAYLTQVIKRNLDGEFPDQEQRQAYYEANLESFQLPNRVHLWQIFIPANEEATAAVEKNAAQLASQLAAGLKKGSKDFARVAAKHSKHLQSKVNDGYMGLLKLEDLLPEVRAVVEKMASETVSAPIRSKSGFHIIRKGAQVAGTQLDFKSVANQITNQMRKQAENRVRQAALKKILETYPVNIDESEIERWREDFNRRQWPIRSIAPE